jgi:hypothetical protein
VNVKSFAKLVVVVAISVLVASLLLGGTDAKNFGFAFSILAYFWVLPAIAVITLYRYVQKRDHGL